MPKKHHTFRTLSYSVVVFVSVICGGVHPLVSANPLTDVQIQALQRGIQYFNTEEGSVGLCSAGSAAVGNTLPAAVPDAYKTLFTAAATAADTNVQFLAALFVTEHGNNWPDPNGPWASSGAGAQGPFQFLPGTWDAYKADGDGNGTTDIQSLPDSAYGAAKYAKSMSVNVDSPLGDLNAPYQRDPQVMLYAAGAYNAGGGTMEQRTTPTSPVDAPGLSSEAINYVKNVYYLISTGFVHGNPGYGNSEGKVIDNTGGATIPSTGVNATNGCNGVVAGNLVQTALNLAWDTPGHGKEESDAKPTYQTVLPTTHSDLSNDAWSDCGVFVSTAVIASGADAEYMLRTTGNQLTYVKNHPEKFQIVTGVSDTSGLKPGDIFINSQHTYIYVGKQDNGHDAVAASWHGHVPQADNVFFFQDGTSGEAFTIARLVGA